MVQATNQSAVEYIAVIRDYNSFITLIVIYVNRKTTGNVKQRSKLELTKSSAEVFLNQVPSTASSSKLPS